VTGAKGDWSEAKSNNLPLVATLLAHTAEATTATDFGACYVFSFPTATKAVGFKHKLSANVDGPLVVASNFENH
jgi:hypothetical protein